MFVDVVSVVVAVEQVVRSPSSTTVVGADGAAAVAVEDVDSSLVPH